VTCTVRGYPSLSKYMDTVEKNPEALKPDCCPKCQCSDLGPHGFYVRMTVRKDVDRLIKDVVHILRFQCDQCHKTFGALPEFISPQTMVPVVHAASNYCRTVSGFFQSFSC
jgi:hypothetical protein